MEIEKRITLPKFGISVIAPNETAQHMRRAQAHSATLKVEDVIFSEQEKLRIKLLKTNPFLRKKFPSSEIGERYMNSVDNNRVVELTQIAQEMTDYIAEEWQTISSLPIAVILYGSTALGLARNTAHEDPSDVDLSVIGNITQTERIKLLDKVRGKREELSTQIAESCTVFPDGFTDYRLIGLKVQNVKKLINNKSDAVINFIKTGARPLHDPAYIWATLENNALQERLALTETKKSLPAHMKLFQYGQTHAELREYKNIL